MMNMRAELILDLHGVGADVGRARGRDALSRSDALVESGDADLVIVMSNSPEVAPAVTYARGVPVMIAGTTVPDSGLSHARLDLAWMGLLKDRFASFTLDDVELRDGRPWNNGVAICTPYDRTDGRNVTIGKMPTFAESVALFDPEHFHLDDQSTSPDNVGLASVIHTLGLGNLVHIDDISSHSPKTADTTAVAALYRYGADNPNAPLVVASARPGVIAATSALDTYRISNPERVLRLCLPEREEWFDEAGFATSRAACRIVIERTLSEPLFGEDKNPLHPTDTADAPTLTLLQGGEDDSEKMQPSSSPTMVMYANPNTIRDDSEQWREARQRRFLLLGANGAEATPAHHSDGTFLPISLGGCTDFMLRRPPLRPGCVIEGVLSPTGDRWVVVSDPIERRRSSRAAAARGRSEQESSAAA